MQSGSILSGIFHIALALLVVFGLPSLVEPPPELEMPNTVEVVTLAPKALAPELTKPPVPKAAVPPKPEAKPPEPTPAPAAPPPKAAEAVPEPKPEPKPEPVPEKKAEIVKPEKKEEPKKEEPKKVEAKKPEKDRFDSILDSVLKNKAPVKPSPPAPQQRPVQQAAVPQVRQTAPTLSDQLARDEMDAVREKVKPCWNFPAGAPSPERLIVDIQVNMNPDGTVRDASIVDRSRMADLFYRAAAEAALRATLNPACQPFPLPPTKYSLWRNFVFRFDPREL